MSTDNKTIPAKNIFNKLWAKKFLFLKVWVITFILSVAYIVPQPRTYSASVLLAPEMASGDEMGGLSAIASSFGFNLGGGSSVDAIYPTLYPDLLSSNDFIVSLFDVQIKTIDGEIQTDLYTYMLKHQKRTFYKKPFYWAKRQIRNLIDKKRTGGGGEGGKVNASFLTEQQFNIVELLKSDIICNVDQLTSVISIKVNAQDPLVAANLADSLCARLQKFITGYRTSKARVDVEHYEALVKDAQESYEKAQKEFSDFCDSHKNMTSQAVLSKRDKLEIESSMALSKYQAMSAQAENAKHKLQEKTPAFTTLQNASVPLRPSAPKRVFFCLGMLILATIVTSCRIFKTELYSTIVFFSNKKTTD